MVMVDDPQRRRSAWRVLLPVPVFALVIAGALAVTYGLHSTQQGAMVLSGGIGLMTLWALADGILRAAGRSTYLGVGRGVDRLVGLGQAATSVGIAIALLPNSLWLVRFVAQIASSTIP